MHWVINFNDGKSPCRVNQASAVIGFEIFSFGGYCQQTAVTELKKKHPIDVNCLNTITYKWTRRAYPQQDDIQYLYTPYFRYGHICVAYNNLVYLWGGRADWTNLLCNLLYCYNPKNHKWHIVETNGQIPEGRDGHSACTIKSCMFIFAGYVQKLKRFSNDLVEFNFQTSTWTLIQPKNDLRPYWRDFHASSSIGNNIYIFGGRMDSGGARFTGESFYSNDLFSFNIQTKTWTMLKPDTSNQSDNAAEPSGRRSHSSIAYKNKIVIFGGFQENLHKHFNDLHQFDTDKMEWSLIKPSGIEPSPRRRHSCCVINDLMFIFGGTGPFKSALTQAASQTSQAEFNNDDNLNNPNNFDRLMVRLERDFLYVQNATRDRSNLNLNELNNVLYAGWNRLEELRNQIYRNDRAINASDDLPQAQQPVLQDDPNEFLIRAMNNLQNRLLVEAEDNQNLNEIIADPNVNNEVDVPVIEMVDMMEQEEEVDDAFMFDDSDSEDLINEETEDEDDNLGLVSLSDLHVLHLDVPTLRLLTQMEIIKLKIEVDPKLIPKNLINEINWIKNQ